MPDYGTVAGVFELYAKVGSVTTLNTAAINRYIDRAENQINMRLASRFAVPVLCNGAAPGILKDLSEELAVAIILRRFFTQEKENVSEWVNVWFEQVNELLEPISTGSATIVCSGGLPIVSTLTTAPWSSTQQYRPSFDNRSMIFQRIDPNRLDDEQDADDALDR